MPVEYPISLDPDITRMIVSCGQRYSKPRKSSEIVGLISLWLNNSLEILGVYLDFTLYIFVASAWIFQWWIKTDASVFRSSS